VLARCVPRFVLLQGHPGTQKPRFWPSQRVSKHTLMKPAPSLPALFRAHGKRRGFSPRAAARHRSRTRGSQILTFVGVYFWVTYFLWDRTSFIVRSQIGGEYDLQTEIFGIATPWRCNKTLSDLKKKWKKGENGISDLKKKSEQWHVKCGKMSRNQIKETFKVHCTANILQDGSFLMVKPLRNCHPSQQVSTPPETLTFW